MRNPPDDDLEHYYAQSASWSEDRKRSSAFSHKVAWIVAGVVALIAVIEGFALVMLLPLKTVVPYTLLVDRQTGNVQTLKPLGQRDITPDDALVRSFLAQYVIARESFDITSLQGDYRKVALWSTDDARSRYISGMQATNPLSPLAYLPRQAIVSTEVLSISSLNSDSALVRFATKRTNPGAQPEPAQHWVGIIKYRFSGDAMSEADRLLNPLGFQVLRYRRSSETAPTPPMPAKPTNIASQ